MKYEMSNLENACIELLSDSKTALENSPDWQQDMLEEKDRILQSFLRVTVNTKDGHSLKKYLLAHRKSCEQIQKKLEKSPRENVVWMKKSFVLQLCIDNLLEFINQQFEEYEKAGKIVTTLSVKELALVFRLFMEEGIIKSSMKKGIARFVVENIRLAHKNADEALSIEHFYTSLFVSNAVTLDAIGKLYYRMAARINKMKKEG